MKSGGYKKTAEDLPEASFAGQQESFLNITSPDDLLDACRKCFASLFTDRAISYRTETGFPDTVMISAAWGLGENVVQGSVNPDEYTVFKPLLTDEKLKPVIDKTLGDKRKKMVYAKGGSEITVSCAQGD
jgi:pyruvate, water dikinase